MFVRTSGRSHASALANTSQSATLRYDGARHSYLSGKRVNQSFRGDQSKRLGFPLRAARCSLSLRERIRVRGNNANDDLPYGTVPGTVKLDGSSRRARMFPKMTVTLISSRAVGHRGRLFVTLAVGLVCLGQGAASGVEAWTDSRLPVKEGVELWFDCSRQNAGRANMGMPGVAGGSPLAYLIDGSGRGRHLAQHRVDARPKLREEAGLAFASFDGTNDVLVGWGLKGKMRETTVFVAASPHSNAGFFRAFFAMTRTGQNDYTTGLNIDLGPGPSAQFGMVNIEGSGAGGVFQMFQGTALPFGGWHILTVRDGVGPKAVGLFLDGKPQAGRDRTDSEIHMDEFALGARIYSNQGDPPFTQGFFHGDISEVIVYSRVLKDEERSAVEHYLSDKYAKLLGRTPKLGESQPLVTVSNPPPVQVFYPGFTVRPLPLTLR